MPMKFSVAAAFVALALLTACGTQPGTPPVSDTAQPGAEHEESAPQRIGSNSINVEQQMSGSNVYTNSVALSSPGYIVVHVNDGGIPGKSIGASELLAAGNHTNVRIQLDSTMPVGNSYLVMLHTDDGNGTFNPDDDIPVIEENAFIMMAFKVSSDNHKQGGGGY
jgi:hypothetical protein